jgi:hypothetical protein
LFGDKVSKVAALQAQQRKLSELVGQLLEKLDHLDQEVQQRQRKLAPDWHESFAKSCQEAAQLSEVIDGIGALIKKGDIKGSEKALNRSADVARHLHEKFSELARGIK